MNEEQLVQFIKDEEIGLVGIGAMTRMIARLIEWRTRFAP